MRLERLARILSVALVAAAVGMPETAEASRPRQYHATPFGTLGGQWSGAYALNDRGQAVGLSFTSSGQLRGFLWDRGSMLDLGFVDPQCPDAVPYDINNRGQVVGEFKGINEEIECHAFLWDRGNFTDLGTLGGRFSGAYGINDHGQIVGEAQTASGSFHAFLWENGQMTDLGLLGRAVEINNRGQVIGSVSLESSVAAFLWQHGSVRLMPQTDEDWAWVSDINNREWVVGSYGAFAALWRGRALRMDILGPDALATGINDHGQIVGGRSTPSGDRGFLWQNGHMVDLSSRGGPDDPVDINNRGQILGSIEMPDGSQQAALYE
jgi:probable HAF family extracellular repeat protein